MRRLGVLEDENRKLKQLVADLSLDKYMLQEVIRGPTAHWNRPLSSSKLGYDPAPAEAEC